MTRSPIAPPKQRSKPALRLRALQTTDRAPLETILRATGVFNEAEVAIALELIDAPASAGYRILVAEIEASASTPARVAGYTCYGATPLTQGTYDLYWIAVDPTLHGSGVGQSLMQATEDAIRSEGGRLVLIETASKPSYDKTRAFYVAWGCTEVARIPDFYAVGDDKVVYARKLDGSA
jgi:ribosomal protein S18 acetylase RimI-like enzyme